MGQEQSGLKTLQPWDSGLQETSNMWADSTVVACVSAEEATCVAPVLLSTQGLSYLKPCSSQDSCADFVMQASETLLGRLLLGEAPHAASVSRNHARACAFSEGVWLYDVSSKNGTFVNGCRVPFCGVRLQDGDRVVLGKATFVFMEKNGGVRGFVSHGASEPGGAEHSFSEVRPDRVQAPLLTRRSLSLCLFTVVCVSLVVVYAHRHWGVGSQQRAEQVHAHYAKGVRAMAERKWEEAEREMSIVRGLNPDHKESVQALQTIAKARGK